MKRLLIWITALTLLFSALIALAGAVGKTAPPPEFAKWFTYADGSPCQSPCLLGIRPGITQWKDIDGMIKAHPLGHNIKPSLDSYNPNLAARIFIYNNLEENFPNIYLSADQNGFVGRISINFEGIHELSMKFGHALLKFGYPPCVGAELEYEIIPNYYSFSFPKRGVSISVSEPMQHEYFNFSDQIVGLYIDTLEHDPTLGYYAPWQGWYKTSYRNAYFHCNQ